MKVTNAKCPSCHANLKIEDGQKKVVCEYCRQTVYVEDDGINIKIGLDESLKGSFETVKKVGKTVAIGYAIATIVGILFFIGVVITIVIIGTKSVKDFDKENSIGTKSTKDLDIEYSMSAIEQNQGKRNGTAVNWALDDVIENNKKYEKNKVTVKYEDFSESDPQKITELKSQMNSFTEYDIQFEYDGKYIKTMTITKVDN